MAHVAAAFGFSRQSYYEAAAALARDGLPGLVPAKPGPRRAHKLTDEVIAHARALLAADATLRAADLVETLAAAFGVRVHPRSIERALAHREEGRDGPKTADHAGTDRGDQSAALTDRYEQLRAARPSRPRRSRPPRPPTRCRLARASPDQLPARATAP